MVKPQVSIVMSVFNGAVDLARTVQSILSQTEVDLEFIVVDDGSTDGTQALLGELAMRDPRLRILRHENCGITASLIRGCEAASAPIIARQDCGDESLPGRLAESLRLFDDPSVVLTSANVRFIGPQDEFLYVTATDGETVRNSLLTNPASQLRGIPHHGSAVFRASAYRNAGGYRPEFYFAQDIDLWMRLAAVGTIAILPQVMYEARVDLHTISGRYRAEQVLSLELATKWRDARNDEKARAAILRKAVAIRPHAGKRSRRREAGALYFIGSCLRKNGDSRWQSYVLRAVRVNPLFLRAWARLMLR